MSAPRARRSTRQLDAVRSALQAAEGFRSAQDLHDVLRHDGADVGLTTVYRHLQSLADAGEVDVLRTDSGEAVYRRCASDEHHHHLVCRACGRTVEVAGPEVEAWADRVAQEHGFADVTHTVEILGLCAAVRADGIASPHSAPGPPAAAAARLRARSGSAVPNRRSRCAYSSHSRHSSRRSKSGQSVSTNANSA